MISTEFTQASERYDALSYAHHTQSFTFTSTHKKQVKYNLTILFHFKLFHSN